MWGDPQKRPHWKWCTTIFMICTFIIILWACIEGLIANGVMHGDLFNEEDSLKSEILNTFETVIDKFEGVSPSVTKVVDSLFTALESISGLLSSTTNEFAVYGDAIGDEFGSIKDNFSNFSLSAVITGPDGVANYTVVLPCAYCASSLGVSIDAANETLQTLLSALGSFSGVFNSSSLLISSRETIDEDLAHFSNAVSNLTSSIDEAQNSTEGYLDSMEEYDTSLLMFMFVFCMFLYLCVCF